VFNTEGADDDDEFDKVLFGVLNAEDGEVLCKILTSQVIRGDESTWFVLL